MPILVWKRGQVIQLSAGVTVQVLDANHGEVRVALQPTDSGDIRERIRKAVATQNRNAALTDRDWQVRQAAEDLRRATGELDV